MGHRCSFAIKDGNAVELFYGHWSAIQLPDQFFWGPDYVETYIRRHEAVDWWMEDIFVDGCVGFDKDQKILLVHRGVGDLSGGLEGIFFFGLMRALWKEQGWRVERVDLMEEVAMHMGYPPEAVRWMPEPEVPWPLDTITDWDPNERIYTLISTPGARFGTNACGKALLANGPELVAHLGRFPQFDDSITNQEISVEALLHIDPSAKVISVTAADPYWERHLPHLHQTWPGWSISFSLRRWEDEPVNTSSEYMKAVRNRVFATLISPAHDPVPGFVTSMSMLGATISPGVATSPPDHNLSMKERSALIARAIELVFEGRRK